MGERLVTGYQDLFSFVKDNREMLTEYLSKSIPRGSLMHWGVNHHIEIKPIIGCTKETLEIVTFSDYDYNKYLKSEYSYGYQGHCSICIDGELRSSQTAQYPSVKEMGGKDVSEYIMEYWKVAKREDKLDKIL